MMMSFEVGNGANSDELNVVLDEEGLRMLMAQLRFLQDKQTDHVHLMAESWDGCDLAEQPVEPTSKPMRHVKITVR